MPRILLIDDDDDVREAIKTFLEYSSYEVVEARDGQEGLDLLDKERFDLVITDLFMPGKDGLGVILESEAYSDIKIILITGGDKAGVLEPIRSVKDTLNIKETLYKPVDPEVLLDSVRKHITVSR
jgi:CheY-like chemotaxis protein